METNSNNQTIILAGATGSLGQKIVAHLSGSGAKVKALVRKGSSDEAVANLRTAGVDIVFVDYNNEGQLTEACRDAAVVVSALSGVKDVIVDTQTRLLNAAVKAGVPRFIPSDYCIDFTKLPYGTNRNLDLRKEFAERLDAAPIEATSVLNGMFTDLLTGQAPVILFGPGRVVYWGNADQLLDFTTMDNTAAYTAQVALDNNTPRFLRIAGEVINSRGLQEAACKAIGKKFKLLRPGGLGGLKTMIKITRTLFPKKEEVFPPWQGMQYLHNMYSGLPKLHPLDNDRYPSIHWTSVQEVLKAKS